MRCIAWSMVKCVCDALVGCLGVRLMVWPAGSLLTGERLLQAGVEQWQQALAMSAPAPLLTVHYSRHCQ